MTADLRREEIARIAAVLIPGHIFEHDGDRGWCGERDGPASLAMAETLYDAGLRSQDTATARIAALRELQSILSGILSDGPVMDTLTAEGPWWTPPDPTGVRLYDAIIAASKALRAVLSGETRTGGET